MKKFLSLLLALAMILSMAACGAKTEAPAASAAPAEEAGVYVDPFADLAEDYDELSQAVYDLVLGEFYEYYTKAGEATDTAERYALMAIAEAKMLSAGVFLPFTSNGGGNAFTRKAPFTNTPIKWGNDEYRYHDVVATVEPIKAEDYNTMKAEWVNYVGTGEYEDYVKSYLTEKGYTLKDTYFYEFTADVKTWDVLASSYAADSEILVNTYDGLVEYDMENQIQPALAESWEVSEDGLKYTFKIREGQVWVDNQGRKVADVKADDFVAGAQHVLDAMAGLEYLMCDTYANIAGADEYVAGETTDFETVGIKALDDYTVEYTLSRPTAYFMTMLGYGVFAPMSREYYVSMGGQFGEEFDSAAATYKYGKGPDSIAYCGPFLITNYASQNSISFETNESYWNVEDNNIKSMTFYYEDGSDQLKPYENFMNGLHDNISLTPERVAIAKDKGTFEDYAFVSQTDATSFCGWINLRRAAFANFNDATKGISPKSEEEIERTGAAMLNQNFRLALTMAIDRGAYNAQSAGEELKYARLINSYTPGDFVNLPTEVTVDINGTATTFPAGTFYGAIVQAQLDADGVALNVWDGASSSGFDGWYNPENAQAYLAKAVEELAAVGIEVSAEKPIYVDLPVQSNADVDVNRKNAVKQSIEAATGGMMVVNLVEYATREDYQSSNYRFSTGDEANFDLTDGSGWGPDYGDPSTYLGTMLPQYSGYMTKNVGIF